MPRRLSYLAVEGHQDAAFIGRLLRVGGFQLVIRKPDLDPAFSRLVPARFPHGDDLLKRVPVPFFHQKEDHAVALRPAGGEGELAACAVLAVPQISRPVEAIGFVLDADYRVALDQRVAELVRQVARRSATPGFAVPETPGLLHAGPPRCGVFVMPDNVNPGTIEDLLLECAEVHYPGLLAQATSYVHSIDRTRLSESDLTEIEAPAGSKKARVAAIGAVLKPGKAIQNSIADNRWLEGAAAEQPRVAAFRAFLRDLLDEPTLYPSPSAASAAASSP